MDWDSLPIILELTELRRSEHELSGLSQGHRVRLRRDGKALRAEVHFSREAPFDVVGRATGAPGWRDVGTPDAEFDASVRVSCEDWNRPPTLELLADSSARAALRALVEGGGAATSSACAVTMPRADERLVRTAVKLAVEAVMACERRGLARLPAPPAPAPSATTRVERAAASHLEVIHHDGVHRVEELAPGRWRFVNTEGRRAQQSGLTVELDAGAGELRTLYQTIPFDRVERLVVNGLQLFSPSELRVAAHGRWLLLTRGETEVLVRLAERLEAMGLPRARVVTWWGMRWRKTSPGDSARPRAAPPAPVLHRYGVHVVEELAPRRLSFVNSTDALSGFNLELDAEARSLRSTGLVVPFSDVRILQLLDNGVLEPSVLSLEASGRWFHLTQGPVEPLLHLAERLTALGLPPVTRQSR